MAMVNYRICSITKKKMYDGWVAHDGDMYFSNKDDAVKWCLECGYESLDEAYDDDAIYWTQF